KMSAGGSRIVFVSSCSDLVVGFAARSGVSNVYLWDEAATPHVRLISSRYVGGTNSATESANANSNNPDISPDGRFIIFTSSASDLTSVSTAAGVSQVYLYDVAAGSMTLLSNDETGSLGGDADSTINFAGNVRSRWISWDDRFIVFASRAGNL